jgi:hypothetical protein
MVLLFFVLLNIIALVLFIRLKKKLHILEIIIYWMMASYLFQNFSAICYMNFKTLIVPEELSYEMAHFFNRTMLYPIIMVTFLHYFLIVKNTSRRFFLIIGFSLILSGIEWLADTLGVVIHVKWQNWWSLSFWIAALIMLVGTMKFYRRILYKGERYI